MWQLPAAANLLRILMVIFVYGQAVETWQTFTNEAKGGKKRKDEKSMRVVDSLAGHRKQPSWPSRPPSPLHWTTGRAGGRWSAALRKNSTSGLLSAPARRGYMSQLKAAQCACCPLHDENHNPLLPLCVRVFLHVHKRV